LEKKEHAKKKKYRKKNPNKQTLVLEEKHGQHIQKIKVRNKQQGTRMPLTKMFEKEKERERNKRQQTDKK
jgi:hypothetical protein